jgi:hypothetical protein
MIWVVLVAAAFLAGLIPQFLEARRLGGELQRATAELTSCRAEMELAELRDLAAILYLEANRKNYGLARAQSSTFFDKVQAVAQRGVAPGLQKALEESLVVRDKVTAGLASGDRTVIGELEATLLKLHAETRP